MWAAVPAFAEDAPAPLAKPAACKSLSEAKLTAKSKTIFVVRVLARVVGRETVAYRAEVIQTLKGTRVEEISFDIRPPDMKYPKDKFHFALNSKCQIRGSLVAESLYIVYVDGLDNPHGIVPIASLDDAEIDRVQELISPKVKEKEAK